MAYGLKLRVEAMDCGAELAYGWVGADGRRHASPLPVSVAALEDDEIRALAASLRHSAAEVEKFIDGRKRFGR